MSTASRQLALTVSPSGGRPEQEEPESPCELVAALMGVPHDTAPHVTMVPDICCNDCHDPLRPEWFPLQIDAQAYEVCCEIFKLYNLRRHEWEGVAAKPPQVAALVDDFSVQRPHWTTVTENPVWQDGWLKLPITVGTTAAVATAAEWNLAESSVFVRMSAPPTATGDRHLLQMIASGGQNGVMIGVEHREGPPLPALLCRALVSGNTDDTEIYPYDPDRMAYLRMRDDGSVIHWETAPETSGPWTLRRDLARPVSLTGMSVALSSTNWRGGHYDEDNNWVPVPGGRHVLWDRLNL